MLTNVPTDLLRTFVTAIDLGSYTRAAEALVSLERALDLGIPRPTQLETDADLASLRSEPAFARLVEKARAAEKP